MIKKTYIKVIGLSFLFVLIISVIYSINVNAEIINGVNSVNQKDKLYVDTPNNFSTMFHNDSNIKQIFNNSSIEFMNLQNTSVIDTTYLDIPNNYENAGLGNMLLNSTLITNQESNSSGLLDDNYDLINDTTIINQENMNPEVNGDFPATHSFNNEIGLTNQDIELFDYVNGAELEALGEVIEYNDGHYSVVKLTHNGSSGYYYWRDKIFELPSGDSVSYELYEKFIDKGVGNLMTYVGGIQHATLFFYGFQANDCSFYWYYGNGVGGYTNGHIPFISDTWYRVKVMINFTSDTYKLYLNDVLLANNLPFYQDTTDIGLKQYNFQFDGFDGSNDAEGYIDSVQYSWESYNDNRYSLPIDMINGTFDNSNNMSINDDNYSEFNSTKTVSQDILFIESIPMDDGTKSGSISDSYIDDNNYFTLSSEYNDVAEAWYVDTGIIEFNIEPNGKPFHFSYDIFSSSPNVRIRVNDVSSWKVGNPSLDDDNQLHSGVNTVKIWSGSASEFYLRVYYFKLVQNSIPLNASLKFNINLNCSNYNFNNFLALNISSYHHTNISQSISVNIYNYDTLNYDLMFSSSNTVKVLNYYDDNTNIQNYFDVYGNLTFQFIGFNITNDFSLFIDYMEIILYYNNEFTPNLHYIEHYIDLDFNSYNFTSFLSMNISSYHFTNISQSISVNIYNYNTLSYDLMFSSSNTVKALNYYDDNRNIQDYLDINGSMNFQYTGSNYANSFQLLIDYFNVIFYYNSEFTPNQYYINKTFSNTFNKLNLTVLLSELYFYYQSSITLNFELLAYNFTSNSNETLAINSYTYLTELFLNDIDDFINENGSYLFSLYAITDEYFNFTVNTFNFLIWIPTYLNHTIIFTEIGNYAYRFTIFYFDDIWNGTEYIETYLNFTQSWIYFSVIYFPTVYLGLKIGFYVYIILMIIPLVILILYTKWYANNKPKLIKSYITYIGIEILLLLLAIDSISIYLTIGSEVENSFVFTLLNALIFGVFLNVVGLNGNGIFKRLTIKGTTLFILVFTSILGFGFFGLLFYFNFPLNYIFNYDIFSTSTADGIRFFSSNFLFFMLILFFSFIVESEVD